ncbi:hypothetical protein WMF18_32895 [Sorangium sp. So ce315]|uniref:hypothetical protein n=1 Tax=Sorangium sp. So ce315 TaxID=3133299 RepID=UPI003F643E36
MNVAEAESIRRICSDLGLPAGDSYAQDWAYELPEEFRTEADLYKYLDAYADPAYGDSERRLLMQLVLDITNDLFQRDESIGAVAWDAAASVLRARPELHRDQVKYWAAIGEALEDAFVLTPLARELWSEMSVHKGEQI